MAEDTTTTRARRIAEAIAKDIFVNGSGSRADRLMLVVDHLDGNKSDLGGWSALPLIDRMTGIIATELSKAESPVMLSEKERTMDTQTLTSLIELADAHQRADEYKAGSYRWRDGGACAIGCTIRDAVKLKLLPRRTDPDNHAKLERLGVPELAWRMCDSIFEGIGDAARPAWTPRFLRAIRPDADYSNLPARIMARLAAKLAEDAIDPALKPIATRICDLWTRRANGNDPSRREWDAAWQQAYAAGRQWWAWCGDMLCEELQR